MYHRFTILFMIGFAWVIMLPLSVVAQQSNTENPPSSKQLRVMLFRNNSLAEGSTSSDAFVVNFTHDGFNGIDWRDAPKMNNPDENLARVIGQNLFSIENRAFPVENEVLSMFINQFTTLTYQFKIDVDAFDEVEAVLFDSHTNSQTLLEVGETIYDFSINHSVPSTLASNRFSIRFRPITFSVNVFEANPIDIYPNPVARGNNIRFNIPSNQFSSPIFVSVYNLGGKQVFTKQLNENRSQHQISTEKLLPGVYLIEFSTADKKSRYTKKLLVK